MEHRKKVSVLCLFSKVYHRVDYPMNEHLNHLIAACNTRASVALGEGDLIFPCRSFKFSRTFLPAAARLWNLLPSGVFSDDTLSFLRELWTCAY